VQITKEDLDLAFENDIQPAFGANEAALANYFPNGYSFSFFFLNQSFSYHLSE